MGERGKGEREGVKEVKEVRERYEEREGWGENVLKEE